MVIVSRLRYGARLPNCRRDWIGYVRSHYKIHCRSWDVQYLCNILESTIKDAKKITPGAWIFVCCECCVLSGRGLCDELITRPEESYRLWCVVVCDLETSRMKKPWPALGCSVTKKSVCQSIDSWENRNTVFHEKLLSLMAAAVMFLTRLASRFRPILALLVSNGCPTHARTLGFVTKHN